ncbi:tetratricopeptide repeat protein [Allosphingosinicella indica]|uniref:Sel1 repeat-containing protein n=1 Tax=Allosphingosinicella indica TaxID=941907 RepID=A0A1X7GC20_9SPHN|nr:SEL1-like repeat protein [Allosphingosinicella indica]SMF67462.1 Sel1 repeat-containing protein [Allosphingosinicella indica]
MFERGAALGDDYCMSRLAHMFDVGTGVPVDKDRAMRLYRRAWRIGRNIAAGNNIAILYRERGNLRAMFQWFTRVAETGDGSAQLDIAKCYLDGTGVRADRQMALRSLTAAVRSDYISEYEREEAQALLATLSLKAV